MIVFKNIHLKFQDKVLFEQFNLEITEGSKVLLKAPSGKGKSSLIKMLLGFITPDKGEVYLDHKKLNKQTLPYFRKNIGYVSQDVDLRNEKMETLLEQISGFNSNKHLDFSKEKIASLFTFFELHKAHLTKTPKELSGGERQRMGLVICALLDRKVWLLDEVTSGLDEAAKEKVVNYIMEQNKTILISSHDKIWTENKEISIKEW